MLPREVSLSDIGLLPARDPAGHKGTFGTLAVFAGSCLGQRFMPGAAALAAEAATRSGVGLCVVHTPEPLIRSVLTLVPWATGVALPVDQQGDFWTGERSLSFEQVIGKADAAVIGPGLGTGTGARKLVALALEQASVPIVLDADGLNCLPLLYELTLPVACPLVITPHAGEFHRLAAILDIKADPTDDKQRPFAAAAIAAKLGCIVVLKGKGTIVSDGTRFYRNTTGSSALATGGSGDVLAGLLGGLVAQCTPKDGSGIEPPLLFKLACLAVHTHGSAADAWCDLHHASAGLTPIDICQMLPRAIESHRSKP